MGKRRKSRILALQWLYQMDITDGEPQESMDIEADWAPDDPEIRAFARKLVEGVHCHRAELDAIITQYASGWSLDRLALVDRNLLRMALLEINHMPDVPHRVAINEAVELAKTFSTAESGRFVNGILGNYARSSIIDDPQT
ncbi:MAG: transcription antitermination factor NusB [Armatimonadetes bacterium CG2_30_59_28]|nr:transcription antitermination factor NusB [Armatimonadota bacterium]OIO94898.1 MAG: transcription antitermination factor NusB [Armatimonadetes bacterium CG2_30_59_28]PIU60741.1 MAG: transcription antitermination factor NusB [Armatimonadetes bacterium CG07_land_8_20_14_0_80_59_28]PIX43386.1 MAG: transcription antitermination factor NusB [Armatimonadetes bacterium CG_4_8_14_3_um_filter_58_9]PIY42146.1 MAG: transcription antitermination factor NusB [Armatimonadetes bacterium CG_4_10_14_3_um_fil